MLGGFVGIGGRSAWIGIGTFGWLGIRRARSGQNPARQEDPGEPIEEPEDSRDRFTADAAMRGRLLELLGDKISGGTLLGVDQPVRTPDQKLGLFVETEATACDMESHAVAEVAREAGIPFIALRIVSDPSHRAIPDAALAGLTESGGVSAGAVMRAAALRPWEIFDLIALALDARIAFGALRRVARRGAPLLGAVG